MQPGPECWRPNSQAAPHRSVEHLPSCGSVRTIVGPQQSPKDTLWRRAPDLKAGPDRAQSAQRDCPTDPARVRARLAADLARGALVALVPGPKGFPIEAVAALPSRQAEANPARAPVC